MLPNFTPGISSDTRSLQYLLRYINIYGNIFDMTGNVGTESIFYAS